MLFVNAVMVVVYVFFVSPLDRCLDWKLAITLSSYGCVSCGLFHLCMVSLVSQTFMILYGSHFNPPCSINHCVHGDM